MTFLFKVALATSFSLYFSTLHASRVPEENSSIISPTAPGKPRQSYSREELLRFRYVQPNPEIIACLPDDLLESNLLSSQKKRESSLFIASRIFSDSSFNGGKHNKRQRS